MTSGGQGIHLAADRTDHPIPSLNPPRRHLSCSMRLPLNGGDRPLRGVVARRCLGKSPWVSWSLRTAACPSPHAHPVPPLWRLHPGAPSRPLRCCLQQRSHGCYIRINHATSREQILTAAEPAAHARQTPLRVGQPNTNHPGTSDPSCLKTKSCCCPLHASRAKSLMTASESRTTGRAQLPPWPPIQLTQEPNGEQPSNLLLAVAKFTPKFTPSKQRQGVQSFPASWGLRTKCVQHRRLLTERRTLRGTAGQTREGAATPTCDQGDQLDTGGPCLAPAVGWC